MFRPKGKIRDRDVSKPALASANTTTIVEPSANLRDRSISTERPSNATITKPKTLSG